MDLTSLHVLRPPILARPIRAGRSNLLREVIVVSRPCLVDTAVEEGEQVVQVGVVDSHRNLQRSHLAVSRRVPMPVSAKQRGRT